MALTFRQVSKRRRATPRELNTRAMALRPERCTGSSTVPGTMPCIIMPLASRIVASPPSRIVRRVALLQRGAEVPLLHCTHACGSADRAPGCPGAPGTGRQATSLTPPTSLALFLCSFAFASSRNPTNKELHGAPSRGLQRLRRRIRLGKANAVVVSRPTPRSGEAEDVPAERNQKDL